MLMGDLNALASLRNVEGCIGRNGNPTVTEWGSFLHFFVAHEIAIINIFLQHKDVHKHRDIPKQKLT